MKIGRAGSRFFFSGFGLGILLAAVFFLAACRPKDPLDLKIEAGNHDEFENWWRGARYEFADDLAREIEEAFRTLRTALPATSPKQAGGPNDPLYKRLNHLTIRQALIAAYNETTRSLLNRVLLQTDQLDKLARSATDEETPVARRRREANIAFTKKMIDAFQTEIAKNRTRMAQLESSPAAP